MPVEAVVALAVAIATPLGYIAYKHPKGFQRIYFPLFGLSLIVMLGLTVWTIAVSNAFSALIPLIQNGRMHDADRAIETLNPSYGWTLIIYLSVNAYLSVLLWLHEILGLEKQEPK